MLYNVYAIKQKNYDYILINILGSKSDNNDLITQWSKNMSGHFVNC